MSCSEEIDLGVVKGLKIILQNLKIILIFYIILS
jgi:hypothetical protein